MKKVTFFEVTRLASPRLASPRLLRSYQMQPQVGPFHLGRLPDGLYLIQALGAVGSVMDALRIK